MADQQTCGRGLAEHSAIPAKTSELMDRLGAMLEAHMTALELSDENARKEHDAYSALAGEFRDLARRLRETATHMASYRDLPMGAHDMQVMSSPMMREAFEGYIRGAEALVTLLQRSLGRDRALQRT